MVPFLLRLMDEALRSGITTPRSLLSIPEAIEELRISRTHFYRIRAQGRIRVVKLGYRVLVPRQEIDRIVNEALAD